MKRRAEEAGLGLNLLVEFESPGADSEVRSYGSLSWGTDVREVLVEKTLVSGRSF